MNQLILATNNPGKIKEIQDILAPIHCIPQQKLSISEAAEIGLTFVENALIKARHASYISKMPALADDSGLVVPALQGAPGIRSARYAGEHACDKENIRLLLANTAHLVAQERHAYFYCVIVLVQHADDPTPIITSGTLHGALTTQPSGEQGFGYDPIFYIPSHKATLAQLTAATKNKISHRARALKQLKSQVLYTHE